jgi:hypothetical protein
LGVVVALACSFTSIASAPARSAHQPAHLIRQYNLPEDNTFAATTAVGVVKVAQW